MYSKKTILDNLDSATTSVRVDKISQSEGHCTILDFLRRQDTHGTFSAIFDTGDNFCYFLFAFLQTKCLLKRGLLPKGSKFFPFKVDTFSEKSQAVGKQI